MPLPPNIIQRGSHQNPQHIPQKETQHIPQKETQLELELALKRRREHLNSRVGGPNPVRYENNMDVIESGSPNLPTPPRRPVVKPNLDHPIPPQKPSENYTEGNFPQYQ